MKASCQEDMVELSRKMLEVMEGNGCVPMLETYRGGVHQVIVRIAWGVRCVTASTPLSEMDSWIEDLEGMELDGMDVGFLIERIKKLREMADGYQRDQIAGVEEQRGDHKNKCKSRLHHMEEKSKKHLDQLMGRLMLSKRNALAESITEMALARW
ncbi:hypothetical protein QJS10_CPA10g01827 [Acorus calamus]|uniref:Uncharacterized protein n=1 Tax=Acorus calamus TaxID=4465 RepID=A0AAV9DZ06_ACOCL|nr:hypothetical protein QJS10_CPA10g01827 [Acorus calamus]